MLLSEVDEEFRANFTKEYGHPARSCHERFGVDVPDADGVDTISAMATS